MRMIVDIDRIRHSDMEEGIAMVHLYSQSIHFFANKQWIVAILVLVFLFFSTTANAQDIETLTTRIVLHEVVNKDSDALQILPESDTETFNDPPGASSFSSASDLSSEISGDSETIETETLDWFADNVEHLIPNSAILTIKDVRTRMTFTAIKCSGKSHLDAEPASDADTAVLKKIFGGKWSWLRRPILIMYNNHVFAASMNGMPHGTKTIKGNGYNGHFCIHFKNSRAHGTDIVVGGHQKAVTIAGEASWYDAR